ncbi:MAG: hypothetical protein WC799_10315 [Desulfobacteraceae bacterium]
MKPQLDRAWHPSRAREQKQGALASRHGRSHAEKHSQAGAWERGNLKTTDSEKRAA